jgi:AbrB family looped-hinge helix DNA binding protein
MFFPMQTKLSTKGQVVLPSSIRRRLGLRPGDALDARIDAGKIVLSPPRRRGPKPRIVLDKITGLPVLTAGPKAPTLTSEQVRAMLSNFP